MCLVATDHGGHGTQHGSHSAEALTIPWLATGPGLAHDVRLNGAVNIVGTAPTVAHLPGLPAPASWHGRVLSEALQV